jgi:glutamate synthase (NADPH/NADH) small chain
MTLTAPHRATREADGPRVTVLVDRCAGCQECVVRCPTGALTMDERRWVARAEQALCVGCRQCVRTCPFKAITVDGPMVVAERVEPAPRPHTLEVGIAEELRAGYASWTEALTEASRCLECPDPTCVRGCPAHNDIPAFIRAIRDRDLPGAHDVLRRTSVLPDVCSRVCNQAAQCEGACSWSLAGGTPVAIGRLERFVTDHAPVPPPMTPTRSGAGLSVGIVGAGPAGIGAAWELIEAGVGVTVYDKDPVPGGLLGWGIPRFTLPERVAGRAWEQLIHAGVQLRCGVEIRPEDLEQLLADYDALILAHGATVPMRLNVPGAELEGVTDATTFLHRGKAALHYGEDPVTFRSSFGVETRQSGDSGSEPTVLVLGAGNTAMDVARTARRMGLGAVCIDWLDERFALARPDELEEARQEGVDVRFLRTLVRLEGSSGRVELAHLAATRQRQVTRAPKVLHKAGEVVPVALVVMAMGYRGDPAFAEELHGVPVRRVDDGLPDRRWQASGILAQPASAYANHNPVGRLALGREVGLWAAGRAFSDRLWAAGDALVGPSTVVESMAQGRRSAQAVLAACPRRQQDPVAAPG